MLNYPLSTRFRSSLHQSEKKALKRHLRAIDNAYERQFGRAPSRLDKEACRDKYMRYYKLKRQLHLVGGRSSP